jgi:lactoylglutathione lyase/glyoxylase I family protein
MIARIAHICLNVRSLRRSLDYYTALGFNATFRFTRQGREYGAYLKIAPGSYLEIFENGAASGSGQNGIAHFCLETDDIDAFIDRCEKNGIAVTPKKLGCDHTWQAWLKDPDGNAFEVHQYTAESLQHGGGSVEADW